RRSCLAPVHPLTCLLSNAPPTTEPYTLSLHDALPIFAEDLVPHSGLQDVGLPVQEVVSGSQAPARLKLVGEDPGHDLLRVLAYLDRKSTRLNSSHVAISYAVFCLKKKKKLSRKQSMKQ